MLYTDRVHERPEHLTAPTKEKQGYTVVNMPGFTDLWLGGPELCGSNRAWRLLGLPLWMAAYENFWRSSARSTSSAFVPLIVTPSSCVPQPSQHAVYNIVNRLKSRHQPNVSHDYWV